MASYARGYDAVKVAALALIAVVAFSMLFLYITGRGLSMQRSDLYVRLPSAGGLRQGDPVIYRGVQVGEVKRLRFASDGGVVARTRLLEPVPLTSNAYATLVAADLFGRQLLVLNDGDMRAARIMSGDTLVGSPPQPLTGRLAELGENAHRLTGDTTIALFHAALAGAGDASAGVAQLTADVRALVRSQQAALDALTASAGSAAHNIALATAPERIGAIHRDIEQVTMLLAHSALQVDSTMSAAAQVLAGMRDGTGSAGMLLRDPALYQRTEALLAGLEALVADVKANPRRYINVSVF